jgi:hypothetical protein
MLICTASLYERRRAMPADDIIGTPIAVLTRGITIDSPPDHVWPWLAQLGSGRAGWYSYDHLDNDGIPSASVVLPEFQNISVGDVLPALPGAHDAFVVARVSAPYNLVLTVPDGNEGYLVTWEFLLEPTNDHCSRLLVRGRVAPGWPPLPMGARPIERIYKLLGRLSRPLMLVIARLGHGIMERRMLRGIKMRVEAAAR